MLNTPVPRFTSLSFLIVALWCSNLSADGTGDNHPDAVRPVPKPGIEVRAEVRKDLERGLTVLQAQISQLAQKQDPVVDDLLPDVEIYHRAVSDALSFNEFFSPKDLTTAQGLLNMGIARASDLLQGHAPWTTQSGLVVRGYRSKIDQTVQPYGLVIPASYGFSGGPPHRLDLWFHGRGETLSEVNFIDQRTRQTGPIAPADTIVLHPYGRYCNAFKFAGEVDVLEALAHARRHYRIDEDRISSRGFSMGGAAAWQFAVHYADRWFAANPGAGFSETPEFLKFFQNETLNPTWYERKLWHLYDCTDYAINLYHCPTVAYSGELDIQKQAADIMQTALKAVGIDLVHIIGPQTKHRIHPDSLIEIEQRLAALAEKGRERIPRELHFSTYTLKYNRMKWVVVTGLQEHWKNAHVDGEIVTENSLRLKTENITDLTLDFPAGWSPFDIRKPVSLEIDGARMTAPQPGSDRSWNCELFREAGEWKLGRRSSPGLRKRHDLQGPIDDAFMDSFIFVKPTGRCQTAAIDEWVHQEFEHAVAHWRRQFRGHARVKADTEIDEADIADANLVLWGDPAGNAILAKIADRLPIHWEEGAIVVGERRFNAATHIPALIFPNPLNSQRYVVLNSGFTYREYDYLNNARQVPKLPDWAVIDVRTPAGNLSPGKIADADFFDEQWRLRPARKQ